MEASPVELPLTRRLSTFASIAILAAAACAPQAAAPTTAPAKPAPTVAPAPPAPTAAAARPAATTAPAKPAATAAPAAKPTEKPAAKAAEFDEKAVADFYKGKTVRIIVGYGPGGSTDVNARLVGQMLGKYIPGNPTVVVENRPGGSSMLAANTVYNTEPKDGTAIASIDSQLALQQALGAPGVQFDSAKFNWLGAGYKSMSGCAARVDSGVTRIQDIMEGGKELAVSSYGKGSISYYPPAVMNAALGTRFKIVTGYESTATQTMAVRNKEVQGWCGGTNSILGPIQRDLLEGSNPAARLLVFLGPLTPEVAGDPLAKGVAIAETLAKTEEARALIQAARLPEQISMVFAVAPEVPKDRVQALRRAVDKVHADPEFVPAAEKQMQRPVLPITGEEIQRMVQGMLGTPPAMLAKLKTALE